MPSGKDFYQEESMSYSLSLASAIFGTFQGFGRNSSLMGIRHVIRPTVSLSYTPDFAGRTGIRSGRRLIRGT